MEAAGIKKVADTNKRLGIISKRQCDEEKKAKSDALTLTCGSIMPEHDIESIVVVGKSCNILKNRAHDTTYNLHECRSETALGQVPENQNFTSDIPCEGSIHPLSTVSCASFISAQSDLSNNKPPQRELQDWNDEAKMRIIKSSHNLNLSSDADYMSRLKELEKKVVTREKKIKELYHKVEECNNLRNKKVAENKDLVHQINILNRQLQSMYELVGQKSCHKTINPIEFLQYKNKTTELQSLVEKLEEDKKKLNASVTTVALELNTKEKELNTKNRELIEYKNRSTLEMCKLINKIDSLKRNMKSHSEHCDRKISEAQNTMDDELVRITAKLEEQYQKDLKSVIGKLQQDFERLASLPANSLEKLLGICEIGSIDWVSLQESWSNPRVVSLEQKILSMEAYHADEILNLKNNYENKTKFWKSNIQALSEQLNEKKTMLEVYESEPSTHSRNSAMAYGPLGHFPPLRDFYAAEIISQNKVRKLELSVFEETVKTLSTEILYRAKTEEIHKQELESAREMARVYREKYENSIIEMGERVQRNFEMLIRRNVDKLNLDDIFQQMKLLIDSLTKMEVINEKRVQKLNEFHCSEVNSYQRDIESFAKKIYEMELFHKDQLMLDSTIRELIENVGNNYMKTVEALITSHVTELSLKQLEMCAIEKRWLEEITTLKSIHKCDLEKVAKELAEMEECKRSLNEEINKMKTHGFRCISNSTDVNMEEVSLKLLQYEGMMAIKEETESALNERVKELESSIKENGETRRREIEHLLGKLVEINVISSAKDDLVRELEEKLSRAQGLLEKAAKNSDHVYDICSSLEKKLKNLYDELPDDFVGKVALLNESTGVEQLEFQLTEVIEKIERLKKEKKCNVTRGENQNCKPHTEHLEEYDQNDALRNNVQSLLFERVEAAGNNEINRASSSALLGTMMTVKEDPDEMESRKKLLATLEASEKNLLVARNESIEIQRKLTTISIENKELIEKENFLLAEKNELEERNKILEAELNLMSERINDLYAEIEDNKLPDEERTYSISLQEVRVLYEEETSSNVGKSASTSAVACQAGLGSRVSLESFRLINRDEMKELLEENKALRSRLNDLTYKEGAIEKFQKELLDVTSERDGWMTVSKNLEVETIRLREEVENLLGENLNLRNMLETKLKLIGELPNGGLLKQKLPAKENKFKEMKSEIGRLSDYVKSLGAKLDDMKTNNDKLLLESQKHLKKSQCLTSELEQAWTQRYEVEDQLSKVRRENALLNLHKAQLEDTNKRISNLITESKPSVASWIKIHETVENIVDEVLALKTSFGDAESASDSGPLVLASGRLEVQPQITSDLSHIHSECKTILRDELSIQKQTLESELEDLEELLKKNDSRILGQKVFTGELATRGKILSGIHHSRLCRLEINPTLDGTDEPAVETTDKPPFKTLALLKNHLENQAQLEETQFRESLRLEIHGLKKEMQKLETEVALRKISIGDIGAEEEHDLSEIEIRYEEDISCLVKEFEREVEGLSSNFTENNSLDQQWEKRTREMYLKKIEEIKNLFSKKHEDVEKKYYEIYGARNRERLTCALEEERPHVMSSHQNIIQRKEGQIPKIELENFLKNIVNKCFEEIKLLRSRYKENLIEHSSDIEFLQTIITKMKSIVSTCEEENTKGKVNRAGEGKVLDVECGLELDEQSEEEFTFAVQKVEEKNWSGTSECTDEKVEPLKNVKEERIDNSNKSVTLEKMQGNICAFSDDDGSVAEPDGRFDCESKINATRKPYSSCVVTPPPFINNEMETDDEKLNVVKERDSLKEMVVSLRTIVAKLLCHITQTGKEFNDVTIRDLSAEETIYKCVSINAINNPLDLSTTSNVHVPALELSTVIQEINDHSLLNSSDHIRYEVDRCLRQIKEDAAGLLTLSNPEGCRRFSELVKQVEVEKNRLQAKVGKVEEAQAQLKQEVEMTKNKLALWERNIEIVSEGYGEEVVEPKKKVSSSDLKEKINFLAENRSSTSQEVISLEEICEECYRLQEEWKREKFDLQQQIDVADKQLHALRKFMEEQAAEREQEREAFDKELNGLKENLKLKERDNFVQNRTNQEIEALDAQIKELLAQIDDLEQSKTTIESEFQNAVKKIWSLREVIQDLESQVAESAERESILKKKVHKLDDLVTEHVRINGNLIEELEVCKNQNETKLMEQMKSLEEERINFRRTVEQINPESIGQLKSSLRQIEMTLVKKTRDLEQMHTSSANASCSSPSEDVSIRDHFDVSRCSTLDEMSNRNPDIILPMEEVVRLQEKLARHSRAEEVALKYIQDLKMQLKNLKMYNDELLTERDVLLERSDLYLKENSGLKTRLEEQRCTAALLQKKLNADLECQVQRLESDWEKLNDLCAQKDKQLNNMKEILENTSKALSLKEAEVMAKHKEENALISTLRTELANVHSEKETLENNLEKTKEKLRNSFKIPCLIESVIEEKNLEIERLEKEVSRLSSEKASLLSESRESTKNSVTEKKHIKFSEPESFEDCISSISHCTPSLVRNCSDSFADFRNSSFKIRQPLHYSKGIESLSSIGPLQLSPRGSGENANWKTSSPLTALETDSHVNKSKFISAKDGFSEESKNLCPEVESKEVEISAPRLDVEPLKRQLTDLKKELEISKGQTKGGFGDVESQAELINRLRENEAALNKAAELLKRKHSEELNELLNELNFERGKVEKVYDEIKTLEVKKIQIEDAFFSLRDEYNEKLEKEQKMVKILVDKIKELEVEKSASENKMATVKNEMELMVKKANEAMQGIYKELADVKEENKVLKKASANYADAEVQTSDHSTEVMLRELVNLPELKRVLKPDHFEQLKMELDKMPEILSKVDFSREDALVCLIAIKNLLSLIFDNVNELLSKAENRSKKIMESSVDELAVKVRKELLLSEKLDNELFSSIEAKELTAKGEMKEDIGSSQFNENDPKGKVNVGNNACLQVDPTDHVKRLEKEKVDLLNKIQSHEKIIKFLEENLLAEKERILAEKERCKEDAKIMELLRLKLEKGVRDIKSRDKDLKKELQLRQALEKEVDVLKSHLSNGSANKAIADLKRELQSREREISLLNEDLESEKIRAKESQLLLEQEKLERISEKETQKLWETDFNLLKEQKENIKTELLNARRLLHKRDKEINLLKRKINLQEIDLKAMNISSDFRESRVLAPTSEEDDDDSEEGELILARFRRNSFPFLAPEGIPQSLLHKMKKLNACVELHMQESNEMGEALLHLSEESEQMRDRIRKLEECTDAKQEDETLLADGEIDRKLWDLEKGKLLLDVETLKAEYESAKRDSIEAGKKNEFLQLENYKLKQEIRLLEEEANSQIEIEMMREKMNHILGKYQRAESYRKALVWQKQYLTVNLNGYRSTEEEFWKKMGKSKSRKKQGEFRGSQKFRVIALAVAAVFRMKFIVKRWQRHKPGSASDARLASVKQTLRETIVNSAYNEPVNPLSYQSQNLLRLTSSSSSSSKVLRTPPSRDPGLQGCNDSSERRSSTRSRRRGNVATAKVLP